MTTETTTDRLSEIKARAEKATSEPWRPLTERCDCGGEYACGHGEYVYGFTLPVPNVDRKGAPETWDFHRTEIGEFSEPDRAFMLHARADVPWLIAEVERLTAENTELRRDVQLAEEAQSDAELELHRESALPDADEIKQQCADALVELRQVRAEATGVSG